MKMMTHFGKQYEKWFTYIVYPMTSWRMTAITLITIYLHDNPEHSNLCGQRNSRRSCCVKIVLIVLPIYQH